MATTKAEKRKPVWRIVHFLILAAVIFLAYKYIDFRRVWELISSADPRFVVGILLIATVDRLLMAYKWRQLLRSAGVPATLPETLSAYYQGSVVAYVPFMVVGSDVLRGYLLVKRHGATRTVLATMVLEKILGIVSGCLLGVLGLSFVLNSMERAHAEILAIIALGGLVLSVGAFAASLYEPFFRPLSSVLRRILPSALHEKVEQLYGSYATFRHRKKVLARNLGLTLIEQFLQMLILLAAGLALGVDLPMLLFLAIVGLILLIRRFAIYIEGWGIAETMSVVLFGLVGLDASTALTVSLLANGVALVAVLPGLVPMARGTFKLGRRPDLRLDPELPDGEAPGA